MIRTALVVIALSSSSCGLFSDAECSTDADCHGGHLCAEGKCVECKSDHDCDTGETCVDSECQRGEGEGEGAAGGEGEGAGGEGEGEGIIGGEGEGAFGGEGEGEGTTGPAALTLKLTWDNTESDVDIHASKGVPYCFDPQGAVGSGTTATFGPLSQSCSPAPLDCDYADCRNDGFTAGPDWDGVSGFSSGDPLLVTDWISVSSSCPGGTACDPLEEIDVQTPVAGTYLVEAAYYSDSNTTTPGPANVTLTVTFHGSTLKTVTKALAAAGSTSDLAILHIGSNGNIACVGDVSDGVDECGP